MTGLFNDTTGKPLAEVLRPETLSDVVGQDHLVGKDGALIRITETGTLPSIILWGPAGCGKTTIARLLNTVGNFHFESVSAIFSGVSDLRTIFQKAVKHKGAGQQVLLFVDEIHRFNKAQQDSFLPYVEDGTIILIGATTENPSFELNTALLSRAQVFTLNPLDSVAMEQLLVKAETLKEKQIPLDAEARDLLLHSADGDGRYFLNTVDMLFSVKVSAPMTAQQMMNVIQKRMPIYDKGSDTHYNMLSAFHKSMRGSDVQASLYWMGRMLGGGEDALSIARRMLCIAYEDIGLADPMAAQQAVLAWDTYKRLGSPEGERALVQACIYLATAPKSNSVDVALAAMFSAAKRYSGNLPPKNILNAPTKLMKDLEYGKDYIYDHDTPDSFSGQNFFPEDMDRLPLYDPADKGFEREIKKRFDYYERLRKEKNS